MNLATTEPPKTVTINGTEYPIKYDFRVWVEVSEIFENKNLFSTDETELKDVLLNIIEVFKLVFENIPNQPFQDIFKAVLSFYKGYPKPEEEKGNASSGGDSVSRDRTFSFSYDLNMIVLAIRNQSGTDLSYRRKEPFHWWEFLLEFQSLEDRHYISKIIGYRAYDGDNKEYLRLKSIHALPENEATQKELDTFNALFS